MQRLDWGAGPYRAAGLILLLGFVAMLRWRSAGPPLVMRDGRGWRACLLIVAVASCAVPLRTIVENVRHTMTSGQIRLDEGQTTWRAAQMLLRGEDPYAQGVLIDGQVYLLRQQQRRALGMVPAIPAADVEPTLERYLETLDPAVKAQLLPEAGPHGNLEQSIMGYKYGPVPIAATAALAGMFGPASVPLTNGIVGLAMFAVVALLLREMRAGVFCGVLALITVMLDREIDWDMLHWSANDLWPLLFGFVGLLASLRGRHMALGIAVALAVGCKIVPGVLFTPLLLTSGSLLAIVAFFVGVVVIYGPFLVWDWHGIIGNVFLWPGMTAPDGPGWVAYAPHALVLPVRVLLGAFVLWIALRIGLRREPLIASAFAALTILTILAGQSFHTNYLTWFSIWLVLAIIEAFGSQKLSAKWQAT